MKISFSFEGDVSGYTIVDVFDVSRMTTITTDGISKEDLLAGLADGRYLVSCLATAILDACEVAIDVYAFEESL